MSDNLLNNNTHLKTKENDENKNNDKIIDLITGQPLNGKLSKKSKPCQTSKIRSRQTIPENNFSINTRNEDIISDFTYEHPKYNFYIPSDDAKQEEIDAFYRALGVPDDPNDYQIDIKSKLILSDPEVNKKLRDLGFTPKQVQAVYDLAVERVLPCIEELAGQYEAERQLSKLIKHFGSEDKWNEVSRQLNAWSKKNLPVYVYEPLSTTFEGVIALYDMMEKGEPVLGTSSYTYEQDDEATLKNLMMSDKYWKEKDPAILRRVTEGFKRLYPSNK